MHSAASGNEFFRASFAPTPPLMVITNPVAADMGVTLLLTAFFLIAGIFRIVASVTVPFSNRLSTFVSGIITFLLGIFPLGRLAWEPGSG